jgi:hypothetical protein
MDHTEALARMADAVAAPGGLTTLVADPSPEAVAVRDHVRGCPACAAEWRAWSVVSLGLAAAAPEELVMRPAARDQILRSILKPAMPLTATAPLAMPAPMTMATPVAPTMPSMASAPTSRPSVVPGGRTGRTAGMSSAAARAARREPGARSNGSWFRWMALAAAAAVLLFVTGAAFGRSLGLGAGEPTTTSDVPRTLGVTADILQGQGYNLAHLQTADGTPGGFVAISPGSGEMVVVSKALVQPPTGVRYVCVLRRDGKDTKVGYMWFEDDLAYWAGPVTDPVDLGLSGDQFLVQLDTPGSEPALTGTF